VSVPQRYTEVNGQPQTTAALLLHNESPVPIEKVDGWAPEPVWTPKIIENSFSLHEIKLKEFSVVQFVAYALYRLSYPDSLGVSPYR
jgi:hypothetical protein